MENRTGSGLKHRNGTPNIADSTLACVARKLCKATLQLYQVSPLCLTKDSSPGSDVIHKAFDWKSLPQNALVVDVGGGVGSAALALAKAYPRLKIIIQDRSSVIENGILVSSNTCA